jgi:hypothetical protein
MKTPCLLAITSWCRLHGQLTMQSKKSPRMAAYDVARGGY